MRTTWNKPPLGDVCPTRLQLDRFKSRWAHKSSRRAATSRQRKAVARRRLPGSPSLIGSNPGGPTNRAPGAATSRTTCRRPVGRRLPGSRALDRFKSRWAHKTEPRARAATCAPHRNRPPLGDVSPNSLLQGLDRFKSRWAHKSESHGDAATSRQPEMPVDLRRAPVARLSEPLDRFKSRWAHQIAVLRFAGPLPAVDTQLPCGLASSSDRYSDSSRDRR